MKSMITLSLFAMAVFALAPSAVADCGLCGDEAKADAQAHAAGESCPCPMCPLHDKAAHAKAAGGDKAAEMTAKSDDAQTQQTEMLLNAELSKNDPAAVLAMRDEIQLTPEQAARIEQIQRQARDEVQSILNAEQKQELASLPEEAASFRSVHDQMVSRSMEPARDPASLDENMTEERASRGEDQSGPSASLFDQEPDLGPIDRVPDESASRPIGGTPGGSESQTQE